MTSTRHSVREDRKRGAARPTGHPREGTRTREAFIGRIWQGRCFDWRRGGLVLNHRSESPELECYGWAPGAAEYPTPCSTCDEICVPVLGAGVGCVPRYNLSPDTKIQSQKTSDRSGASRTNIQVVWF